MVTLRSAVNVTTSSFQHFDCELKVCHIDSDGRFIILRGEMQDHPLGHLH